MTTCISRIIIINMEEQKNRSGFINNIAIFIKQHKTGVVVSLILLMALLIIILNKGKEEKTQTITPTPTRTLITPTPGASFFLNQLTNSKSPVNGTTWIGDKLYYSNTSGFLDAGNNSYVGKDSITYISFSENGKAVYFNLKEWVVFNLTSNTQRVMQGDFAYPKISPDGTYIVDCKGSTIYIYNSTDFSVGEKNVGANLSKCEWAKSSNYIAATTVQPKMYSIKIFNNKLEEQGSFESEIPTAFISISPNADLLLVEQNGALNLIDNSGISNTIYSNPKSKYIASWIDDKNVVVIETRIDSKGKQSDYFWKYNISGKIEYLTSSMPIAGKINTNIPLSINQSKNVIAFSENSGRVWLLSLNPGKMAFYSEKGITFIEMSSKGGEY